MTKKTDVNKPKTPGSTTLDKKGIDSGTLSRKSLKSMPFTVETLQGVNAKLNLLDKEIDEVWRALKELEQNQYQLQAFGKRLNDSLQAQNAYLALLVDKVKVEQKQRNR